MCPQKINKMPEFCMIFAQKIVFARIWGQLPLLPPPVSYAYAGGEGPPMHFPIHITSLSSLMDRLSQWDFLTLENICRDVEQIDQNREVPGNAGSLAALDEF